MYFGDFYGGYYFVFIKFEKDGCWYKFDDDRVMFVIDKEVLEDNYGGDMLNGFVFFY